MHRLLQLTILCFLIWNFNITKTFSQSQGCEQVKSSALDKIIPLLERNNFQQIEEILRTVETSCGTSEVTLRIRILGQLIQKQETQASIRQYLGASFDDNLIDRLESAADEDYLTIYRKNKKSYEYVPLRHPIDSLIQVKSAAILKSDMYQLSQQEESLALLFSDHINTYLMRMHKQMPVSKAQKSQKFEIDKSRVGYVISGGAHTPLNAVNPIFKTNPIFGFSVITPLSYDWLFEGFLKARINSNDRDFEYKLYDNIEVVNSRASYLLGANVGYKFLDLGRFLMHGKAGIAFETVDTGLSERDYYEYYDEWGNYQTSTKYHNVNTYNLSAGVSAMQHLAGRTFIGAQIQYHYSPYNNYRRLITPIASDYVSFELFFKF